MAFTISRIDKRQRTYTVADSLGGTYTTVDVALLPVRSAPTAATVWTSVPYSAGVATVVWAGPDADSTGAIVVPATADMWIKGTNAPYVQAIKDERITVLGGANLVTLPGPGVASVNGKTGTVVLTAADIPGSGASDATTSSKGIVQLAGDLAGTAAVPTVPALANKVNTSTYVAGLAAKANTADLAAVSQTGSYNDLANKPTLGTAAAQNTTAFDAAGAATAAAALRAPLLTPTATKTGAYTAAVGDLAMMNVPGGATVLTLPTAPANKSQVGYRAIGATTAVPLTVNRGGTDTIGTAGATSATIELADEVSILQYDAPNTRWLGIANVKSMAAITEVAQDATAAMFAAGTHTGVGFTYDDAGGAFSAALTGDPVGQVVAGRYITSTDNSGATTLSTTVGGAPAGAWVPIWTSTPVDRIGVEVSAAGGAGAVLSLALYKQRPGSAIMDFVLVTADLDATTTGFKEGIISTTLAPGRYAIFVSNKNSAATTPTVRATSGKTLFAAAELAEVADRRGGIHATQVGSPTITATWPSTFTLTTGTRSFGPAVYLRSA